MKIKILISSLLTLATLTQSCSKPESDYQDINNENENGTLISSVAGSTESHNMGMDCISCHFPGGQGEKVWKIAGTVYNLDQITPRPNTVIKLYTGPNETGVLKYTLTADAYGNFYTSGIIDFTGGLYPVVTGTITNTMSSAITTGACNSCHTGTTTQRIVAE